MAVVYFFSGGKMVFQSSFILTTVQPLAECMVSVDFDVRRNIFDNADNCLLVHVKSILRRTSRIVLGRLDTAKTEMIGAGVDFALAARAHYVT
jgi:hypothetical protein